MSFQESNDVHNSFRKLTHLFSQNVIAVLKQRKDQLLDSRTYRLFLIGIPSKESDKNFKGENEMILEAVMLQVKDGMEQAYEDAFHRASSIISSMKGYRSHELQRCLEVKGKYLLLVQWETLEDHMVGFRQSNDYQEWRRVLHRFYDPFPTVEHFKKVSN